MIQFYFLSIVANFLSGTTLASDYIIEKFPSFKLFQELLVKRRTRISLGFLTAIVGILKLIVQPVGERPYVAGDLVPALVGIALGSALLVDYFKERVTVPAETMGKVEDAIISYRIPLGVLGVIVALLHFFIPRALLL